MAEPKRYHITRETPAPVRMSDFGVARDDDGADAVFHTTFSGEVTPDEHRAMFGADADIVRDMSLWIFTPKDRLSVLICADDVLACQSWNTSHQFIINAFREDEGLPPLGDDIIEDAGLGWGEIGPDATLFLMEMYDGVSSALDTDPKEQLARARERGFTIADFMRPLETAD